MDLRAAKVEGSFSGASASPFSAASTASSGSGLGGMSGLSDLMAWASLWPSNFFLSFASYDSAVDFLQREGVRAVAQEDARGFLADRAISAAGGAFHEESFE